MPVVGRPRPRLYLSSYLLGDDPEPIRWHGDSAGRAGIVLNALDPWNATRRRNWDREAGSMRDLGYDSSELDLRDFVGEAPSALDASLAELDLLWIVGGNAHTLARLMTAIDFGSALVPALDRGLTYAGYSAAACVAGPDLAGIDLMDEPDAMPDGYDPSWPTRTLGLISERIVPHWESDHSEAADAERARAWLAERGLAHRCLRDGEALVVER